jgi:hypothetical protein
VSPRAVSESGKGPSFLVVLFHLPPCSLVTFLEAPMALHMLTHMHRGTQRESERESER